MVEHKFIQMLPLILNFSFGFDWSTVVDKSNFTGSWRWNKLKPKIKRTLIQHIVIVALFKYNRSALEQSVYV
jgi:hypothetical protein